MQIHEVLPTEEKPPSDKTKPDIVTQIAGPTLGSSTPNYNPDYAIQGTIFYKKPVYKKLAHRCQKFKETCGM